MKGSGATSATPTGAAAPTGRSSDRPRPTRTTAEGFALTGPSRRPDPAYHAYRKDLADVALAGEVLASHYAEPVARVVAAEAVLRSEPTHHSAALRPLDAGETFQLLEDSLGWAWGYAASDHHVGYLRSDALAPAS